MTHPWHARAADGGEIHTHAAIVQRWPGESAHYFVNEEGFVVVSAIVQHGGIPVHVNLDALVGGARAGIWTIPDEGTEILLGTDDGDFEGELYVIHRSSKAPAGLVPGKVLIIGLAVEVRSTDGTPAPLPTLAEHNALASAVRSLTLPVSGGTAGPTVDPIPTATGTKILSAE